MKLCLAGHSYRYAAEQLLLMLFPAERPEYTDTPPEGDGAVLSLFRAPHRCTAVCRLTWHGVTAAARTAVPADLLTDPLTEDRLLSGAVKRAFYRAALRAGVPKPVWGSLTGVRPAKLMERLLADGLSDAAAVRSFSASYDVEPDRARLCLAAARAARGAKALLRPRDVCLYIGIPFCPTRCAYCSFVSASVGRSMAELPPFLAALHRELAALAAAVREAGLRVVSLYVGGGTPTTLSAEQLDGLFRLLEAEFDLSALRESTVEAGRPDTITRRRLEVLRLHGVDRVSVNPQTMDDHVLEVIGRKHTAQAILDALALVRSVGGFAVNMDLIAGLPADTCAGFRRTVDTVCGLRPENITVHTLSRKRGAGIGEFAEGLPGAEEVGQMLAYAGEALAKEGYAPYYLYRQKFMSGGFENVGWTRPGFENFYNICIMEELCSILAAGGGGSTKLVAPGGRIERSIDPKYPHEYIAGIDRICEGKQSIKEFYSR